MADTPRDPKRPTHDHPAGGWGALISSGKFVLKEQAPISAALSMLRVNQAGGFDCPGCAWPEPTDRSSFEFCENGVKAVAAETTGKRVTPAFFAQHPVTELRGWTDYQLEQQGRLTHPMWYDRETDRYLPVTWEQAFNRIGQTLRGLDHPDQAIFYTSGRTSNEAAFLYQLFGRMYGTNNFPDCSNMCHESSGVALGESIGVGKGTVRLEDFDEAEAIFVIGQNPGTNHPRMLSALQAASQRGADIVAMNPLRERGLEAFKHPQHTAQMLGMPATPISKLYLQPTIGGDMAALMGIAKLIFEAEADMPGEVLDHAFIDEHTKGFDAFKTAMDAVTWDTIETQSGLARTELQLAADVFMKSNATIICWAMGLTQHKHAVPTIQMAVNLLLMRGQIGKPGAGACPVRGHSNVQGDRTMGITELPKPAFLDKLGEVFDFEPPREHGYDVVSAIEAMQSGDARVFFAMGGNFAAATPDTDYTYAALEKCELTVHVSTKLNRSHTVVGQNALILPCLGRTERDETPAGTQAVTVEDSMSQVHLSRGNLEPASSQLLSEPAIVAGLAKATLPDDLNARVGWDDLVADYNRIRDRIADVIPGFDDFNRRVRSQEGFYLGNTARDRRWATDTGRANFVTATLPDITLPEDQLRLMTIRSHDQYNTTVYDNNDRYRGVTQNRQVIFVHPDDADRLGFANGDRVDVHACWNDDKPRVVRGFEIRHYDIARGCAAAYFPECNVLVAVDQFADRSRTPVSKLIPIRLTRS